MDPDNQPSTSKRAKDLKKASDELNTSNEYPVTFEEFRKFTNVENYVEIEMKRSGPRIYDLNYHIRHKYYPAVYKNFYKSKSSREKMLRRGLKIKPIPKFLKDKLMQMPSNDTASSDTSENKAGKGEKLKVQFAEAENITTSTACEKSSENIINKVSHKNAPEPSPKTINKSTSRQSLEKDKNGVKDSQKITNFFSALKLIQKKENNPNKETKGGRKRKSEATEISPIIKRAKDVDELVVSSKSRELNNKAPLSNVNRKLMGPKSKRKTLDDRVHGRGKYVKERGNSENRRQTQRSAVDITSDDSDIHSNVEVVDLNKTQNASGRRPSSRNSSPSGLAKSPLPKRNRIEDFQKPTITHRKSAIREDSEENSDQEQGSSDTEMALLSLSGAVKKAMFQVSCEIHDWLNKSCTSNGESDCDSVSNFLEERFTAIDKLTAIEKYPDDVRKYIKFSIKREILKRKIMNKHPENRGSLSKSKMVAVFREMTFDDYKTLINADKIYAQEVSEERTHQSLTADLRAQYIDITNGKRAWPRDHHIKLTTLRSYFCSKGLKDPVDLVYIPPRLLSFEETLEYTNIKEHTSLRGSEPPASYKQLLSLCKKTYLKCCAEGVWIEGLHFIDLNYQYEEMSQLTQCEVAATESQKIDEATEPAYEPTKSNVECLEKNHNSLEGNTYSQRNQDLQSGKTSIAVNDENSTNNIRSPIVSHSENTVERTLEKMFADSQPRVTALEEFSENAINQVIAESKLNVSVGSPDYEKHLISQPVLDYIPPSPALFQSSGENENRSQISESQQPEIRPPEEVFIPCDRSVMLNTEENNMTIMSVHSKNNTTDPFAEASRDPEVLLENIPEQALDQNLHALKDIVKKEPESSNNTQTSYNPLDDSVQILDIPPSEPITIDDEETAPELLNMLLVGPTSKDSFFSSSTLPPSTAPTPPPTHSSPHTQTSPGTDTFVYAQRLPSNLCSTQSLLNPSQTHEESSKEHTPKQVDGDQQKGTESLKSSESRVKKEVERDIDAYVDLPDIDRIMNIIKMDPDVTIKQSPSQRNHIQDTTDSLKTIVDLTDIDEDHSYSVNHQRELSGGILVPLQRLGSVVEMTQGDHQDLSLEEILQSINQLEESLNGGNKDDLSIFKETAIATTEGLGNLENTDSINNKSELKPRVCEITTQKEITLDNDSSVGINNRLEKETRNDIVPLERMLLNAPMATTEDEIFGEQNYMNSKDVELSHIQVENPSSLRHLVTTKNLNDNVSEELTHLSSSLSNGLIQNQELGAPFNLPQTFIEEISNELFIACNVEVSTISSQRDVLTNRCEIESIQVRKCDNASENNQLEENAAETTEQMPDTESPSHNQLVSKEVVSNEIETAPTREGIPSDEQGTRGDILADIVQNKASAEEIVPKTSLETNQCSASSFNTIQTTSNPLDCGIKSPRQEALAGTPHRKENHAKSPSNTGHNMLAKSIESSTAVLNSALATDTQELENEKMYILPALLPIAALKSAYTDDFIENPEVEDDPGTDDDKDDLVEVPVLINRRFIKMLPFNIVTPLQIQQTTKESTIYALKAKLEFCLQEVGVLPEANSENNASKNDAIIISNQTASPGNQKTAGGDEQNEKYAEISSTKHTQNVTLRKSAKSVKLKSDHCSDKADQPCLEVSSDTKATKINAKKKRVTPKKAANKPTALDFVPQKTHPFRSLRLAATRMKTLPEERTEKQTIREAQTITEESNYNIEDVSQAAVASSTASQILGTDCTYFESSQLLRNIQGCCQPEDTQRHSAGQRKTLEKPKVNTFDRISLSEGLMARRIWQVNLNWRSKHKMSLEAKFSFNKKSLTVCNSSVPLLFIYPPALWSDILRVLREIDHFEYKRLATRNYQAATPLHKVLRHLFDSAPQIANAKLTIDSHDPYASCEIVKPLHRKPFQCLTKAIAPNVLSRMRAKKESLRDNMDN